MMNKNTEGTISIEEWVDFTDKQTNRAKEEMRRQFETQGDFETQPKFIMEFCKQNEIDYKTYKKWLGDPSKQENNIRRKQRRKIEVSIARYLKYSELTLLDLPSIGDISSTNNSDKQKFLAKDAGKLIELFKSADGFIIEYVWLTNQAAIVAKAIKESDTLFRDFWGQIQVSKKNYDSSLEFLDANIALAKKAEEFLESLKKISITLHIARVNEIFLRGKSLEKEIIIICLNAIPKDREDIKRDDLLIIPNLEKIEYAK